MAAELDSQVAEFRARPLDQGPYTFVAADALVLKVREGGRVVNVHAPLPTGVNGDGHREILGLQVTSAEDGAGRLGFFRDLSARGLSGVRLVTSDAHYGLVAAVGATLHGASWQRCRTHDAANLMAATPKASWPWVRALLPEATVPSRSGGGRRVRAPSPGQGSSAGIRAPTRPRAPAGTPPITAALVRQSRAERDLSGSRAESASSSARCPAGGCGETSRCRGRVVADARHRPAHRPGVKGETVS